MGLTEGSSMRIALLASLALAGCPSETEPAADAGSSAVDAGLLDAGPTEPKLRPPPRAELLGAFDESRRQLVFFGGDDGLPVNCQSAPHPVGLDDLWVYDAASATFEEIVVEGTKPPARARGMAVYDPSGDQMVIFGGRFRRRDRGDYINFRDVWALDLGTRTWREIETDGGGPSARSNPAGGLDRARGEMIVFGGNTSRNGLAFGPQMTPTLSISPRGPGVLSVRRARNPKPAFFTLQPSTRKANYSSFTVAATRTPGKAPFLATSGFCTWPNCVGSACTVVKASMCLRGGSGPQQPTMQPTTDCFFSAGMMTVISATTTIRGLSISMRRNG